MKTTLKLTNPFWSKTKRRALLDKVVQESGVELEAEIKKKMLPATRKSQPAGRTYRRSAITAPATKKNLPPGLKKSRSNPNKVITGSQFHRASAPGQAPAIDTGGLVNSIRAQKTGEMKSTVSAGKAYAEPLDGGARAPSRRSGRRSKQTPGLVQNLMGPHRGGIAPRPFFRSTVKEFVPKFKENVQNAVKGK